MKTNINNTNNSAQIFRALKYRNFKLYFAGQSISLIGTWIQMIAMSWLVYDLSHSAFLLGVVGFLSRIPTLVFAPFAGVIADRFNKYKLLFLTQILAMIQAVIITILLFANAVQIWHILVLGIFLGIINSFDIPVRQSFVIELIEKKEDLSNAIALNSAMVNGARLIGPSIAGLLVASFGESWCFMINSLSFIAILSTLMLMKIQPVKISKTNEGYAKKLKEGFKYVFGFRPIRDILILLALVSLMGMPFQVLMPVFAKDIYGGGPNTLGFLMASVGLGALIGALYLAQRKSVLGLGRNLVIAAGIFGAGLISFSLSQSFWLSIFILLFAGFGMMVEITASNTLIQTISDDDKRGRVMSFYTIAFMGTVPFGNLLSGIFSDLIGVSYTVLLGGVFCIIGAVIFAIRLPGFRKLLRPIYIKKEIISLEI
jgi:MFS family permease